MLQAYSKEKTDSGYNCNQFLSMYRFPSEVVAPPKSPIDELWCKYEGFVFFLLSIGFFHDSLD